MKIFINNRVTAGVFQFPHRGAMISVTTRGNFPEVAVFVPNEEEPGGREISFGPFSSIPEAIQLAEHLHMQRIVAVRI